jgi:hypothetical protein
MNAYAVFVVHEHMESLLAEAAKRRMSAATKPSLRQRIASAATSIRSAFTAPAASPASTN